MFADPYVLTRNWSTITAAAGDDISFAASERAADHSTYRAVDGDVNDHVLFIGHQYGRRSRFTARYSVSGVTPALLIPDQNQSFTQSVYVVVDVPNYGPVWATTNNTTLFRRQMAGIGSFLIGVSADPLMKRIVNGET